MNEFRPLILAVSAAILILAGCAKEQQYKPIEQICVPGTSKDKLMQIAEATLGEMHFIVVKADAEQGYIRTQPLRGAQFFEFWRKDNVGAENAAQANLHSIQRTAKLSITQKNGSLCVDCDVNVQRLSLTERDIDSSTQAHTMFSNSNSSIQTLKLDSREKAWIDLGTDAQLETAILKQIENKIKKLRKENKP